MEGPPLQEGIGWDGVGARGSLCPSPLRPLSSRALPTLCPASGLGPPARGSRLHCPLPASGCGASVHEAASMCGSALGAQGLCVLGWSMHVDGAQHGCP